VIGWYFYQSVLFFLNQPTQPQAHPKPIVMWDSAQETHPSYTSNRWASFT